MLPVNSLIASQVRRGESGHISSQAIATNQIDKRIGTEATGIFSNMPSADRSTPRVSQPTTTDSLEGITTEQFRDMLTQLLSKGNISPEEKKALLETLEKACNELAKKGGYNSLKFSGYADTLTICWKPARKTPESSVDHLRCFATQLNDLLALAETELPFSITFEIRSVDISDLDYIFDPKNGITDVLFPFSCLKLSQCSGFKYVSEWNLDVNKDFLKHLIHLNNVTHLYFSDYTAIDQDLLEYLISSPLPLTSLSLVRCDGCALSPDNVKLIIEKKPDITYLNLTGSVIGDATVKAIAEMPNLTSLYLRTCVNAGMTRHHNRTKVLLSNESILSIAQSEHLAEHLEILDLGLFFHLNDKALSALANLKHLTHLSVDICMLLSSKAVKYLVNNSDKLVSLNTNGCLRLTESVHELLRDKGISPEGVPCREKPFEFVIEETSKGARVIRKIT